jgi:hypothetical protein
VLVGRGEKGTVAVAEVTTKFQIDGQSYEENGNEKAEKYREGIIPLCPIYRDAGIVLVDFAHVWQLDPAA